MRIVGRGVAILLAATALCSCGRGTESAGGSAATGIDYYIVGQSGTMTSPWGDGSSSHQPAVAVKFTPASYPVTIKSVTIYANNSTGSSQLFNVYGYPDLAAPTQSLQPLLFPTVLNQSLPDKGSSYIAKTVAVPETTITTGSFYIAVEWGTKPLNSASGANSFFILSDSRIDYPRTNFIRFGTTWSAIESTPGVTSGDLGIVVNY
jgi:hypothetical protein